MNDIKPITVKDIQNSLRIDDNLDAELIQRYINTAEAYVQSAVDSSIKLDVYRKQPQFNTAVALFTEYLYQSRGMVSDSPNKKPFEITAMILQLKGIFYDYKNSLSTTE